MKKVFLVASSIIQDDTSGFITEYEKKGCKIDGILILSRQSGFFYRLRYFIRIIYLLKPNKLIKYITNFIAFIINKTTYRKIVSQWGNKSLFKFSEKKVNLETYAKQNKIPLYHSAGFNPIQLSDICKHETLFVMYGGGIVDDKIINIRNAEFINTHMGKMPTYRGMNVIEWAVLEGNEPYATTMLMNSKIDDGEIILEKKINIAKANSISSLREQGFIACYKLMAEAICKYKSREIGKTKQIGRPRYYYRMHPKISVILEKKLLVNK